MTVTNDQNTGKREAKQRAIYLKVTDTCAAEAARYAAEDASPGP